MNLSHLPILLMIGALVACAEAPEAVVDDATTGFALYRSGRLSPADLSYLCSLGVKEILVLDGEGAERECLLKETLCPDLEVRYDFAQEEDTPVSLDFLQAFDAWIEEARREGRKVAFRCRHGWHRTGRLAAYYRIRFEEASPEEANREMQEIGHMMWKHPTLAGQVAAYGNIVAGEPCTAGSDTCPNLESDGGLVDGRFADDACIGRSNQGSP